MPVKNMPVKNIIPTSGWLAHHDACNLHPMKNLKQIREQRGLSQADLAEMAEMSQGTISKIESGYDGITLRQINKLATCLEVEPVTLFGASDFINRVLRAADDLPEDHRSAALTVLESMSRR
ncbi:helix-turn-helix domain-containing protein [Aestuariibius insulae]|uniref:helix-turn-helix domain-containing protein n=1 Tax=Aestuariibius insulae TaxID=2058287 RepID=UPI00345EA05C